jgi:hypothetical protein
MTVKEKGHYRKEEAKEKKNSINRNISNTAVNTFSRAREAIRESLTIYTYSIL